MWSSRYVVGSGWQSPELIETDDAGHATLPVVHQGDALFHIAAIDHPERVGRQIDSITEAILASEPQGSAQGMLDEDEVV